MRQSDAELQEERPLALTPDAQKLVEEHLGLVRQIVRGVIVGLPPSVEIGDLIGAGHIGLCDAARKYNPLLSEFVPYARIRIRGAMLDYLRMVDYVSRSDRQRYKRYKQALDVQAQIFGRPLVEEERIGCLGGKENLKWYRQFEAANPISFEKLSFEGRGCCTDQVAAPQNTDPFLAIAGAADTQAHIELLCEAWIMLTPNERTVLAQRYVKDEPVTLAEIGRTLKISEQRTGQIEQKALELIRLFAGFKGDIQRESRSKHALLKGEHADNILNWMGLLPYALGISPESLAKGVGEEVCKLRFHSGNQGGLPVVYGQRLARLTEPYGVGLAHMAFFPPIHRRSVGIWGSLPVIITPVAKTFIKDLDIGLLVAGHGRKFRMWAMHLVTQTGIGYNELATTCSLTPEEAKRLLMTEEPVPLGVAVRVLPYITRVLKVKPKCVFGTAPPVIPSCE